MKIRFIILMALFWFIVIDKPANSQTNQTNENAAAIPSNTNSVSRTKTLTQAAIQLTRLLGITSYPRWEGGRSTSLDDPRWKVRSERNKIDPWWAGKIPIEFYGKVVDESSNPIAGANASFSWVDLSLAGTSQRVVKSDAQGNFSIAGIKGASILVNVSKDGYIASVENRHGYDFASFWEKEFYQPNPAQPEIFHLRKRGETEPLVHNSYEVPVTIGNTAVVKINNGQSTMSFTLLSNDPHREGKWEAQVSIQNGGIIPATQEFITQAPLEGYQQSMTLDKQTPKPPEWQLYEGGSFYFQSGQNYGRIDVQMIAGNKTLYLEVWINPKLGSRNIELP